jgi:hypothetical protein
MEQILVCLLAKMNAMDERTDTNLREIKAEIRTNQEEMRTDQEEMTARLEAKVEANNEKYEVKVLSFPGWISNKPGQRQCKKKWTPIGKGWKLEEMKAWQKGRTACQEATEAKGMLTRLQTGCRARDHEANSRVFRQDSKK